MERSTERSQEKSQAKVKKVILNGDFDTIRIIDVKQPNNLIVMINRYFTEKEHKMVEITEEEYYELLNKKGDNK